MAANTETQQVCDQPPFDQASGFPATWPGAAVDRPTGAHDQPALPQAVEQHQESQGRQREARAKADGALCVSGQAAAHVVEQQHPHHHDAEHHLNPEADPAHAAHAEGQLLEIKAIRHGWGVSRPNLPPKRTVCTPR
jgi:hypothetical protein